MGFAAAHRQPVEIAVQSRDKAIETVPIKTDTVVKTRVIWILNEELIRRLGLFTNIVRKRRKQLPKRPTRS